MRDHNNWASYAHTKSVDLLQAIRSRLAVLEPAALGADCCLMHAGMTFSGMAVVSLMVVMPASMAADALGRKWTIIPSCLATAAALSLMAVSGQNYSICHYTVASMTIMLHP